MPAIKTHTEELRAALIDEAGKLLRKEGAAAVTLRRLARASRTSTSAVYTLFGNKAGLIEEMYVEGFRRLTRAVTALDQTSDPFDDLVTMGAEYRRAALRSPYLYELMFSRPVPGFKPSAGALAVAAKAAAPLVDAVKRCIDAGVFNRDADAEHVAYQLWALAHGLVSLEIHRTMPLATAEFERRYVAAMTATAAAYAEDVTRLPAP